MTNGTKNKYAGRRGHIKDSVIKDYISGESLRSLSLVYEVDWRTIRRILTDNNISLRDQKEALKIAMPKRDIYKHGLYKQCLVCHKKFYVQQSCSQQRFCSRPCYKQYAVGSNSPNWKGGFTPLYKAIRNSTIYQEWRYNILTRDHFTCCDCKYRGQKLEVHHVVTFSSLFHDFVNQYSESQDLWLAIKLYSPFWNFQNAVTLCDKCHEQKHIDRSSLLSMKETK